MVCSLCAMVSTVQCPKALLTVSWIRESVWPSTLEVACKRSHDHTSRLTTGHDYSCLESGVCLGEATASQPGEPCRLLCSTTSAWSSHHCLCHSGILQSGALLKLPHLSLSHWLASPQLSTSHAHMRNGALQLNSSAHCFLLPFVQVFTSHQGARPEHRHPPHPRSRSEHSAAPHAPCTAAASARWTGCLQPLLRAHPARPAHSDQGQREVPYLVVLRLATHLQSPACVRGEAMGLLASLCRLQQVARMPAQWQPNTSSGWTCMAAMAGLMPTRCRASQMGASPSAAPKGSMLARTEPLNSTGSCTHRAGSSGP